MNDAHALVSPLSDPHLGVVVGGRYRVTRRIGKGGMSAIYEAAHVKLPRAFALKVLAPELAQDREALERFRREADVVARLRHPNIVEIVDWEALPDGTPCIVMELLRGEDLSRLLARSGPLAWPRLAQLADELLGALAVTHQAGIIHRDLKPQNLFVSVDDAGQERCKLLDFGISKVRLAESVRTLDRHTLGTPEYMSPEQAEGLPDQVGPETDVWAMGAILYELATGKAAFAAPSTPAILYRICHGKPDPLRKHRPNASDGFVQAVELALTRDPERRLSSVEELRDRLRAAFNTSSTTPQPAPRRSRRLVPLAATLVVLCTALPFARRAGRTPPAIVPAPVVLPAGSAGSPPANAVVDPPPAPAAERVGENKPTTSRPKRKHAPTTTLAPVPPPVDRAPPSVDRPPPPLDP